MIETEQTNFAHLTSEKCFKINDALRFAETINVLDKYLPDPTPVNEVDTSCVQCLDNGWYSRPWAGLHSLRVIGRVFESQLGQLKLSGDLRALNSTRTWT